MLLSTLWTILDFFRIALVAEALLDCPDLRHCYISPRVYAENAAEPRGRRPPIDIQGSTIGELQQPAHEKPYASVIEAGHGLSGQARVGCVIN